LTLYSNHKNERIREKNVWIFIV